MMEENSYRKEIDGLRAIAVLSVIFYHYKLNIFSFELFKGGYFGVDIFFVVSGYLISKILITDFYLKKKKIYIKFIERRSRRILPALLFVILFSSIFSFILLSPENFEKYFKSLLASIFFYSNFFFHFSSIEYGAIEGNFEPLLHTWSLSIEEQFYLIYPIFLLTILKNQSFFKYSILILLLTSFFISEFLSRNHPSINFYLFITRIWEFLFGFLAISNKKNNTNNYFPYAGIIMILFSIFFLDTNIPHPSYFTLIPVLGTFLILKYINSDTFLFKILSYKIFAYIGKISYSLYLWHFPIFVFVNTIYLFQKINFIIFLIPVFILSSFSYFYIEKPFRNHKTVKLKNFIIVIIVSIPIIISLNLIFSKKMKNEKNPKFYVENINLDNIFYKNEKDAFYNKSNTQSFAKNNKKKVLIIGNSHGRDLYTIFKINESNFEDYAFIFEWTGFDNILKSNNLTKFKKLKNNIIDSDLIILSSLWTQKDLEIIDKVVPYLKRSNKEILLSSGNPMFTNFQKKDYERSFTILDKFLFKEKRLPNKKEDSAIKQIYYDSFVNNKSNLRKIKNLTKISNKYNLKILDQISLICNKAKKHCEYLTSNKRKIFYDDDHITLQGAKYLGSKDTNINYYKNLLD